VHFFDDGGQPTEVAVIAGALERLRAGAAAGRHRRGAARCRRRRIRGPRSLGPRSPLWTIQDDAGRALEAAGGDGRADAAHSSISSRHVATIAGDAVQSQAHRAVAPPMRSEIGHGPDAERVS
jgi:hypothetical protein